MLDCLLEIFHVLLSQLRFIILTCFSLVNAVICLSLICFIYWAASRCTRSLVMTKCVRLWVQLTTDLVPMGISGVANIPTANSYQLTNIRIYEILRGKHYFGFKVHPPGFIMKCVHLQMWKRTDLFVFVAIFLPSGGLFGYKMVASMNGNQWVQQTINNMGCMLNCKTWLYSLIKIKVYFGNVYSFDLYCLVSFPPQAMKWCIWTSYTLS